MKNKPRQLFKQSVSPAGPIIKFRRQDWYRINH